MKQVFSFTILIFLFCTVSCQAQLIKTISDAPKLVESKDKFIGKPLKILLSEISPQIKFVLGAPENSMSEGLGNFQFYFINKDEYLAQKKAGNKPLYIYISLSKGSKKDYPPLSSTVWDKEKEHLYEDMIVQKISVMGKSN